MFVIMIPMARGKRRSFELNWYILSIQRELSPLVALPVVKFMATETQQKRLPYFAICNNMVMIFSGFDPLVVEQIH